MPLTPHKVAKAHKSDVAMEEEEEEEEEVKLPPLTPVMNRERVITPPGYEEGVGVMEGEAPSVSEGVGETVSVEVVEGRIKGPETVEEGVRVALSLGLPLPLALLVKVLEGLGVGLLAKDGEAANRVGDWVGEAVPPPTPPPPPVVGVSIIGVGVAEPEVKKGGVGVSFEVALLAPPPPPLEGEKVALALAELAAVLNG